MLRMFVQRVKSKQFGVAHSLPHTAPYPLTPKP